MSVQNFKSFYTRLLLVTATLVCFTGCSTTLVLEMHHEVALLHTFCNHFNEFPIYFIFDISRNPDLDLFSMILMHQKGFDTQYPFLYYYLNPAEIESSRYQKMKYSTEENVVVFVPIMNNAERSQLWSLANSGMMSKGTWLVPENLLSKDKVVTRYDSNVYLYDMDAKKSSATIEEIFSIKKKHRFLNIWGNWTLQNGLTVHTPHMWERRIKFLYGVLLKGVYLEWSPFTFVNENGGTYGVIPEIIAAFQVSNFSYCHCMYI